jgi:hypothetical protein
MYGGELGQPVDVSDGSFVNIYSGNISGGVSGGFTMSSGSHTTMRGGWFTQSILKQQTATLVMEGVDFAFDGVRVPGLVQPGDEVTLPVPPGAFFTGVFANGSPFTFSNTFNFGDDFYGDVILRQSVRPTGAAVVNVPADPMPAGVLPGQTLIVNDGAVLPLGMNGAPGSTLDVRGGHVRAFEAYQTSVNITGGQGTLTAYTGSTVTIAGGSFGRIAARDDAVVHMQAGQVTTLAISPGAGLTIDGGSVVNLQFPTGDEVKLHGGQITGPLTLPRNSTLTMTGGVIPELLRLEQDAKLVMSGGRFGDKGDSIIQAFRTGEISLIGRQFLIGGQPIPGLQEPGDSIDFSERPDSYLSAILADGSPFETYVGSVLVQPAPPRSIISPMATLRLTLVPEPSHGALIGVIALMATTLRRRFGL